MSIRQNQTVSDPSLADLLNLFKNQVMMAINCHAIATVQEFSLNENLPTIKATINYSRTYFDQDSKGKYVPVQVPYPILVDVPVICLAGGSGALTFPIAVGDQCLILFNDRDLDNWFKGATSGPVATPRLHSFSDGIALVGLNRIPNYDTQNVTLRNDAAYIRLTQEKIKLANEVRSLKEILDNLVAAINGMTVTVTSTPGTYPVSGVSGIGAQIGELLE